MHPLAPDQVFEELFVQLHASRLWKDGKSISDAVPRFAPSVILAKYRIEKLQNGFDLKAFFEAHFIPLDSKGADFESDQHMSVNDHILRLWPLLTRSADQYVEGSSLLALPHPYIVPGGRFNEIYYWDSFFTMLGLQVSGRQDLIKSMLDNFAWMLNKFGLIPNGNRSYYLGRSQPPFFSLMVSLLAETEGDAIYVQYLDAMLTEYGFWMEQTDQDLPHENHLVRLADGQVLNRYHDKYSTPRPEMYQDDLDAWKDSKRSKADFFQNIRASAASGWDFSARWMDDTAQLATTCASDIVPVDLNCLLYSLESIIAKAKSLAGDNAGAANFKEKAEHRKQNILAYCWNEDVQFFCDYNHKNKQKRSFKSLAAVYPLYFKLASKKQAQSVADTLAAEFLKPGGLVTTTIDSGQQWDAPNGWPPLQWMAYQGLINYGHVDLANEVKTRWLALNDKVFKDTGKMLEKYNVIDMDLLSGGGEYPVQDGFGWTNGVYLKLINT